jgi:carboxyl-terminal processing protease
VEFKEDNIAHLKIIKFSDDVNVQFNNAMNKIIAVKSKGIILDLRDNPGGLLDKSVEVASRMIPKGKIVVSEEDSQGKKENLYTAGGDKLSSIPTVVLINEGSASASEILAGALKDNQNLTLIGEKTFGKGSVQQLMDLPGGSSVKITVAKWLTPNGDYIMEKGISPDIEIKMTNDDYENDRDPQFDKAMEVIKDKIK